MTFHAATVIFDLQPLEWEISFCLLYFYLSCLLECQNQTWNDRDGSSTGLLAKWPQRLKLDWSKARSQEIFLDLPGGYKVPSTWSNFHCFSRHFSKSGCPYGSFIYYATASFPSFCLIRNKLFCVTLIMAKIQNSKDLCRSNLVRKTTKTPRSGAVNIIQDIVNLQI